MKCQFIKKYKDGTIGKECDKEATHKAKTIIGEKYYCSLHAKKRKESICVRSIKSLST